MRKSSGLPVRLSSAFRGNVLRPAVTDLGSFACPSASRASSVSRTSSPGLGQSAGLYSVCCDIFRIFQPREPTRRAHKGSGSSRPLSSELQRTWATVPRQAKIACRIDNRQGIHTRDH